MGSKGAHMPGGQRGGLGPIRTAHHFKRTYVSASIEYSVEPVNHASARWANAWGRRLVVPAYPKGRSFKYPILAAIFFPVRGKRWNQQKGRGLSRQMPYTRVAKVSGTVPSNETEREKKYAAKRKKNFLLRPARTYAGYPKP